ncbi:Elongator complex protein 4 OS=Bos taurus GN=ELP4 PE=2 SV=1 [Rhizoctonia solani AG-1 IB]|uniref:Elongator complex protein 4 n=1 Tax=Thanatephorus cucumeris (strain AG1-IB / isolate 7/3/14) TaxID=1108050 RepID=A0A0B7FG55_THACB|nr:Elongator complex protein 4 OS=Bos taurus GN=ELP4 PE=2 SV=1 [Rhizoctonia solani AG-1 IB]
MSSFKRRTSSKVTPTTTSPPDQHTTPKSNSEPIPSPPLLSGLSSIDDILGLNGLPTGQVLLVRAPDPHSAWGSMVSRYFIAQGFVSGEAIVIVSPDDDTKELLGGCMWTSDAVTTPLDTDGQDPDVQLNESIKIAWRYAKMKQFSTTVPKRSGDQESATFDLTLKIPAQLIDRSRKIGQVINVPLPQNTSSTCDTVITHIRKLLQELNTTDASARRAIRIVIPDLGSPAWGDIQHTQIIRFLLALRGTLRGSPAAAFITLADTISGHSWGGNGWEGKLSHVTDSCITLAGFGGDPLSSMSFPNHHGSVKILSSPCHGTLKPPSISRSILRGMTSSGPHGGGENNLAFRCTRRRLVIETMHLGAEGGIGARQTTAPTGSEVPDSSTTTAPTETEFSAGESKPARVKIAFDDGGEAKEGTDVTMNNTEESEGQKKKAKPKGKRVLFQSDKPEIYDF